MAGHSLICLCAPEARIPAHPWAWCRGCGGRFEPVTRPQGQNAPPRGRRRRRFLSAGGAVVATAAGGRGQAAALAKTPRHPPVSPGAALATAAEAGDTVAVAALLDEGADIEARNKHGRSALALAAGNGHTATTTLLLDRGASTAAKDREPGDTPLIWAARRGRAETAALLLDRRADSLARNKGGMTALTVAAQVRARQFWPGGGRSAFVNFAARA